MVPTKHQPESASGKWPPWSLRPPKKGTQKGSLLSSSANHSSETVVSSRSAKTQDTVNRRGNALAELPQQSTSNVTMVQPVRVPTQNSESEWPQSVLLTQINVGLPEVKSLAFLDCGRRVVIMIRKSQVDGKTRQWIQSWSVGDGHPTEIETPLAEGSMANVIAASKDGKRIVSGYQDGRVVIWNAGPGSIEMEGELKPEAAEGARRTSEITALDISPDSSYVAVGSADGMLFVWSITSRKRVLGPLHHQNSSQVSSVKFSPVGRRIASGYHTIGEAGTSIHLWHTRTGVRLEPVRNQYSTYSLAWSVDGHRLFAGVSSGSIMCFDVLTRSLVEWPKRSALRDLIMSICLSNSGQFLVSVSSGRTHAIDIWDISTTSPIHLHSQDLVSVASISEDDSCLISVGSVGKDSRKEYHVTSWCLSTLLGRSYLFRRLSPSIIDREPTQFTYVSHAVLEAWKRGNLEETEQRLQAEIEVDDTSNSPRNLYALINRAIVRTRRKDWDAALKDAATVREQPDDRCASLIACIVEGIAFHRQGKCREALDAFKFALWSCDSDLFKCIKSLTLLEHHDHYEAPCETDMDNDLPRGALSGLVKARKALLACRIDEKDYEGALQRLQTIPDLSSLLRAPDVITTSLLFGWDLDCLISDIHEVRCQALFRSAQAPLRPGKMDYFSVGETELTEDREAVQEKLSSLSEEFGDKEMFRENWNKAVGWYSEALILAGCPLSNPSEEHALSKPGPNTTLRSRCPQCIADLLAKRSEVYANMKSWPDALTDATQAIENDPSYPWGYERKFVALHAQGQFKEAVSTLKEISLRFTDAYGPEILHLRNYTETISKIDELIRSIFDKSPFVVIDVQTGLLCDQEKRRDMFENDSKYYELVSSMSTSPDPGHIEKVVEEYFHYVMFSHTWDGEDEPSFELVVQTPVYDLPPTPLNKKLGKFCETVRGDYKDHGYRWSWSDTCCIDKKNPDIFEKSIRFMYKWYRNSALTLVRLADPSKSMPRSSQNLGHNRWMFRAWTLQELLAPKVIRFYKHDWELYRDGDEFNHKMLPGVRQELQGTMTTVENVLQDNFDPSTLTVRQRLQLASTREAKYKADIAYALIGIFSSDIHVDNHREGDIALGLLLQEVVNRQGDVTVLDWIGLSSAFNSSIPALISVYKPESYKAYKLPQLMDEMVKGRAGELNNKNQKSLRKEVTSLHDLLHTLGLPRFADRRLSLPCIAFSVSRIKRDDSGALGNTYVASMAALGDVQFETADTYISKLLDKSPEQQGRVVLVYPWIRDLLAEIRRRGGIKHYQASSLIVYLEQGFRALLFAEQSDQQYRRVATDKEIVVPKRNDRLASLKDVSVEVLEVWERS